MLESSTMRSLDLSSLVPKLTLCGNPTSAAQPTPRPTYLEVHPTPAVHGKSPGPGHVHHLPCIDPAPPRTTSITSIQTSVKSRSYELRWFSQLWTNNSNLQVLCVLPLGPASVTSSSSHPTCSAGLARSRIRRHWKGAPPPSGRKKAPRASRGSLDGHKIMIVPSFFWK